MSPGTLVKILHNKAYGLTSDFPERTGLILNLSKVPGLYDVYDILLDDGTIVPVEDRLLRRVSNEKEADEKEETDQGSDR
jgi:hypothetical protein